MAICLGRRALSSSSSRSSPCNGGSFLQPRICAFAIPNATSSPVEGSATLTDAQAADLVAGKYYVNIHTAANPGGEIRGQVMK